MIVYFSGPEGAGKTAFMTRYNRIHHLMGGECWAFPGFELLNERGRVVSRLVMPEEIMSLLDEMQWVVLSIDEIQNFMHHHAWADKLVEIMAYGAAAQRRKREFVILATGPLFDWVPRDLRQMFHEIIHCEDMHWKNHDIPRGQRIKFYREDRRGVLSGHIGTTTRPQIFFPSRYFKYYDTYALTDPKYQFRKVKVKKETIYIDGEGRILPPKDDVLPSDPATLEKYIQEYEINHQDVVLNFVRDVIKKLKSNNIEKVESDIIYRALGGNKTRIGQALNKLGATYEPHKKIYDLSGVEI